MPAFLAAIGVIIIEYLIKGIIWLVKRLLIAFGVGVIAYVGIQPFIDYLIRVVVDLIVTDDTYQIAAWLGVVRFGECASVMLSRAGLKCRALSMQASRGRLPRTVGNKRQMARLS